MICPYLSINVKVGTTESLYVVDAKKKGGGIEPLSVLQSQNSLDRNCNHIIRSRQGYICMTVPKYARLHLYLPDDAAIGKTVSIC